MHLPAKEIPGLLVIIGQDLGENPGIGSVAEGFRGGEDPGGGFPFLAQIPGRGDPRGVVSPMADKPVRGSGSHTFSKLSEMPPQHLEKRVSQIPSPEVSTCPVVASTASRASAEMILVIP